MLPLVLLLLAAGDEVQLPIDKAVVYEAVEPGGQGVFARLSRNVVVVGAVPAEKRALALTYALGAAPEPTEFAPPKFKAAATAYALSVGPLLDSPDTVKVKSLTQRGEEISLLIEHTQKGLEGAQFRRNQTSRPMVQVPLNLPPGTYLLTVTWTAVPGLPGGKPFKLDPVSHVCRFTVTPE